MPQGAADLDGRVAMVTGGTAGIGEAVVEHLASLGARVYGVGRSATPPWRCDVTDPGSVAACVEAVIAETGRIDVLVNSAGVSYLGPAEDLPLESWATTIAVNLTGAFIVCQAVGRHMLAAGRGRIINISSQAATTALDDHAAYSASKAGLGGLTRSLASEWGPRGITVNTVSPTVVMTEMGRRVWSGSPGEAMLARVPTGRFAELSDVTAAVAFLAGDAGMINGVDLLVDGGYTIR